MERTGDEAAEKRRIEQTRARFAAWLDGQGGPRRELAALFRCSEATISQWKTGIRTPSTHWAIVIEGHTGIPYRGWLTDEELRQLPPASPKSGTTLERTRGRRKSARTGTDG